MITDITYRKVQLGHVEITIRIKKLLKERAENSTPNIENLNIWEQVWNIESGKKKNTRYFTQLAKNYLYALLLYSSVIISLIYMINDKNYFR
jgi:hypothetical protein